MSRSKLEHIELRRKNYDADHSDNSYTLHNQDSTYLLQRLSTVEQKLSLLDNLNKNQSLIEQKVEELASQFERYLSEKDDSLIFQLEEKYELLNSKLDKGLLVLQRDIQELDTSTQMDKYYGSQFAQLEEQIKEFGLDIEEVKINCQQMIKEMQGELLFKIQEAQQLPEKNVSPKKKVTKHVKTQSKSDKKEISLKRQRSENHVLQCANQSVKNAHKTEKSFVEKSFVEKSFVDYDQTKKRIDDEINRRISEENEKRKMILQKENEADKMKHIPLATEKSRSKEIQNRLNLERKTKQEKINQLNDLQQYKRK